MQSAHSGDQSSFDPGQQKVSSKVQINAADQLVDGRFALAFENAPVGMAIVGTDYRLKRVNPALCEALGYPCDELLDRTFLEITHPDDLSKDKQLAARLFKGEIPAYKIEKRIITSDGTIGWIDLTALVIRDENMAALYGLAMVENITEKKRAADALRMSEERYRSFVVNSNEAIWRLEAETPIDTALPVSEQVSSIYASMYIAECNDTAARLYGRERADDMVGLRLGDANSYLKTGNASSLRTFVRNGYRLQNKLLLVGPTKGKKRYLDSTVIGVAMNGYLMRIWGVQRDETDQRIAQQRLKDSRQQMRSLVSHIQNVRERERANLAREMHDVLGQPLASIKIQLTNVQNSLVRQGRAQENGPALGTLNSTTGLIEEAINSVRAMATELRPGVLDKFGLVAATEWQCHEFERRTGIKCKVRLTAEDIPLPPQVSTAIFRILQEALTNVASHSQSKECTVELRFSDRQVSLNVIDTGRGISDEDLNSPTSLGLLGMRERTEMIGGKFSVRSNPGRGTTLSVQVRIKPSHQDEPLKRTVGR